MGDESIADIGRLVLLVPLVTLIAATPASPAPAEPVEGPLFIHHIAAHPTDSRQVFAITSNMGVLASADGGRRWTPSNRGLTSFTHHALVVVPGPAHAAPILYIGGWGGGVSKSADGGRTWIDLNGNLGNTAVDAIAVDPASPGRLYLATSTQIYRTSDEGRDWNEFGAGLPPLAEAVGYKTLIVEPAPSSRVWLGTIEGLFYLEPGAARWIRDAELGTARVSALAYDGSRGRVYVGTIKGGLFAGTGDGWTRIGGETFLISGIAVHPRDPRRVYVATRGSGIYLVTEGAGGDGPRWTPSSSGLSDRDIRSVAIHPAEPSQLFVGTSHSGFFRSTDGGASWSAAEPVARLAMEGILAMLDSKPGATADARSLPAAPEAFAKCNTCHGWSDPRLNMNRTYWRVPVNPRRWETTVARMADRAGLTDPERRAVVRFLTTYSRAPAEP